MINYYLMTEKKHLLKETATEHYSHMKYKICVSGAAETEHCSQDALELSRQMGREIVNHNGVVLTGATIGIPYFAARGAKEAGGISIGLSPAATERAHVRTYHLPTDFFDLIIYTGFDYSGRNLLLTRSADAVVLICGRMGTLNEFTIAFEDNKPIGILEGTGGVTEIIKSLVARAHRGTGAICYDSNPKRLVAKVIKLLEESQTKNIRSNTSSQKNRRRIK